MSEVYVSIVIPTYNEVDKLKHTLDGVLAQVYPPYEVIVVNDGSEDDTAAYIDHLQLDVPFTPITQPNGGAAAARNAGWRAADGKCIVFIDSGCKPTPGWLEQLVQELQRADAVGGKITLAPPYNLLTRYVHAANHYQHYIKHGQVAYLLTANMGIWRSALEAIDGFRPWAGVGAEDVDLCYRLREAGYTLAVSEQATVVHNDLPGQLRSFSKKYFLRGYANVYYSQTWVAMGYPRSKWRELIKRAGAVVLSPYLGVRYAARSGWRDTLGFIGFAFVEHMSFGAGMLWSMLRGDSLALGEPVPDANAPG